MASKKDKTMLIILGIAAVTGIGLIGYAYYKRRKQQKSESGDSSEGAVSSATTSSASTSVSSPTYISTGAKPPKYNEVSGVLQSGSYGRKIAKLQIFINRVKPNSVTVDGILGNGTITQFNTMATAIQPKIGFKPKLSVATIDGIENLAVNMLGYKNFKAEVEGNSAYQKVSEKYTG